MYRAFRARHKILPTQNIVFAGLLPSV